ncbi:hypothetical protein L7F22_021186 [Adiantum nelumboides]|nr:hypothetical protein [Adiantum nelumboides]
MRQREEAGEEPTRPMMGIYTQHRRGGAATHPTHDREDGRWLCLMSRKRRRRSRYAAPGWPKTKEEKGGATTLLQSLAGPRAKNKGAQLRYCNWPGPKSAGRSPGLAKGEQGEGAKPRSPTKRRRAGSTGVVRVAQLKRRAGLSCRGHMPGLCELPMPLTAACRILTAG